MYLEARFTLKQWNLGLFSFTSLGRKNQFFLRENHSEKQRERVGVLFFYNNVL